MSQTTVNEYRARDIQGQVHNLSEATTDVRVVDSATNIVPGYAVIKGTADNEVSYQRLLLLRITSRVLLYGQDRQEKKHFLPESTPTKMIATSQS